jgi:hypothetical protein
MRGTRGLGYIGSTASTGIDQLLFLQAALSLLVVEESVRLHDGSVVPMQSQPAQIIASLVGRAGLDARRIDVFYT